MISANTRINPIQNANQVKTVTKMDDGSLRVELKSGRMFLLSKDDELFQAFIIYSVLNRGF